MFYKKYKKIIIILSIISLILIDQISKYLIFNLWYLNNNFLIQTTLNKWISWWISIFSFNLLIIIIPLILIFIYFLYKKEQISSLEFIFIFSWWLWNFIDRIFFHWVRDFISLPWFINYHFPIFNLADVFVSLWFIIIIIQLILPQNK